MSAAIAAAAVSSGRPRGEPLLALGAILTGWVSARAVLWEAPVFPATAATTADLAPSAALHPQLSDDPLAVMADPLPLPRFAPLPHLPRAPLARPQVEPVPHEPLPPTSLVVGQQLLFMSAFSDLPLPESLARTVLADGAAAMPPLGRDRGEASRWSADGWLLLRPDGAGGAPAFGAGANGTYGASQAGAVVRYRLSASSPHRPAAYVRATAALDGSRQKDLAAGVSVRPIADVPVVAAVEVRVTDDRFGSRVRPVAMVVAEPPTFDLGGGVRAEAYGQAGYVGGEGETAFADGQVRVDRHLADLGRAELRVGAGAWAGAQKGAHRVDVGPTASLGFQVSGKASARMGVDWRFRVDGKAEPSSGPALTLSAGF